MLNIVFFAAVALFYQTHANLFMKEFTEGEIEKLLPAGSIVEIGKIEGGILEDISARNIRITPKGDFKETFDIKEIDIDYRLWYPIFGRSPDFSDETPKHFRITQAGGAIDISVEKIRGKFFIESKINHVKLQGVDLIALCQVELSTKKKQVNAHIILKNVIVNLHPFEKQIELFLSYDSAKKVLNIKKFKIGDEIQGQGYYKLSKSQKIFLKWMVVNLHLEDYFSKETFGESISGTMNGSFTLNGPAGAARLLGHLDVQAGNIGNMNFDSIIGNLKGIGPIVSIEGSRIRKGDGYIIIGGEIDFGKLKDRKAFDNVEMGAGDNFFVWDGWSVTKARKDSSVNAEKIVAKDFSISFKAHKSKEDAILPEERFLGVERKVKF